MHDLLFFFNDTATTEIYTLSLHDALPICAGWTPLFALNDEGEPENRGAVLVAPLGTGRVVYTTFSFFRQLPAGVPGDRKSTRLNSSHANISYAVFCLKKKNIKNSDIRT